MDRNHKLDAPNNEELKTIQQLEDHSGVSTVYRDPTAQFDGDILTAKEREKVREDKYNAITGDVWKSSLYIGFYIPFPFVSGILLAAILYYIVGWANSAVYIAILIITVGAWMIFSYFSYARIFKIFYKHALQAGPFLFVMLLSVLLASQAMYDLVVTYFAGQSLLFNLALISLLVILYSIVASFIVLLVWGNTKISGGYKIATAAVVIVVSGFLAAGSYLF